jgi:hypothetical protein
MSSFHAAKPSCSSPCRIAARKYVAFQKHAYSYENPRRRPLSRNKQSRFSQRRVSVASPDEAALYDSNK